MDAEHLESCLAQAWWEAALRVDVRDFFLDARAQVDARVTRERPLCLASGGCCNFEAHGHLLYVSGLEAAFTVLRLSALHGIEVSADQLQASRERGDCPYLQGLFCGAHHERPLGCRIYFCDERAVHWQSELYESTHQGVQRLHERLGLPYRYMEWRAALHCVLSAREAVG